MGRLNRYVGKTILGSVLLVLAVLVGLDAITAFIDEANNVSATYTMADVGWFVLFTLPGRVYEFVPFAALIGCLLGLGQLASSSELVVMRAAGVSTGRLAWMVMRAALLVTILGALIGEYIAPSFEQIAHSRRAVLERGTGGFTGRHGLWNREGSSFMHFDAVEPNGVVYGATVLNFNDQRRLLYALYAERASYQGDHWLMENVTKTEFTTWSTRHKSYQTLRWDTQVTPDVLNMVVVPPEHLSVVALDRYSRYLQLQGLDARDYQLAYWKKILQPLAV